MTQTNKLDPNVKAFVQSATTLTGNSAERESLGEIYAPPMSWRQRCDPKNMDIDVGRSVRS